MTQEHKHPDRTFNLVLSAILVVVLVIVGAIGLLLVNNLQKLSVQLSGVSETMVTREEIKEIAKDVAPWNDDRTKFETRLIKVEQRLDELETIGGEDVP